MHIARVFLRVRAIRVHIEHRTLLYDHTSCCMMLLYGHDYLEPELNYEKRNQYRRYVQLSPMSAVSFSIN